MQLKPIHETGLTLRSSREQDTGAMPAQSAIAQLEKKAATIVTLFLGVLVIGTLGYRVVSQSAASWVDCVYMTVITITTIGFGEIVDLSHSPGGRIFTMFIALSGIGILTYVLSTVTQLTVDGAFHSRWRQQKMLKAIQQFNDHYLVCGWSDVVPQIIRELQATERKVVLVVADRTALDAELGDEAAALCVVTGDPADDNHLRQAGVERAAGVFAVDSQDHTNIVLCLTARSLNPKLRIIATARDVKNEPKIRKAGADAVVSPTTIGALRMASEMVRPTVVTFLDQMLRDTKASLRVEEIPIGAAGANRTLGDLKLDDFEHSVVLAVSNPSGWVFKPKPTHRFVTGDVLLAMTTAEELRKLTARCSA